MLKWVEANKGIQNKNESMRALTDFIHQELDAAESETPEPVAVDATQFKVPPGFLLFSFGARLLFFSLTPTSSPVLLCSPPATRASPRPASTG